MNRFLIGSSLLLVVLSSSPAASDPSPQAVKPSLTWQNVISNVLARPGTVQPGDVYSVGIPRSDLKVTVKGVPLEPSFALTSSEMFRAAGKGSDIVMKGDLLLLPDEVNPVMSRLMKGGFQITALHNHLMGENPRLMDLHFEAKGASGPLAATLRDALALTGVHRYESASELIADDLPPPDVRQAFKQVEQILGQPGSISRRVLQIAFPRRDPIRSGKEEIPLAMGGCVCLAFQGAGGSDLAATGELVVIQEELMPVLQALRLGDIEVASIHNYMLGEEPPLKYIHFWAKGSPEKIATALRAAIDQIAIRR